MDKNHSEERCSVDRYTDDGRFQILVDSETGERYRFVPDDQFGYVIPIPARHSEAAAPAVVTTRTGLPAGKVQNLYKVPAVSTASEAGGYKWRKQRANPKGLIIFAGVIIGAFLVLNVAAVVRW